MIKVLDLLNRILFALFCVNKDSFNYYVFTANFSSQFLNDQFEIQTQDFMS